MLYLNFVSKSFSHEKIVLRISKKSQSVNDWLFKSIYFKKGIIAQLVEHRTENPSAQVRFLLVPQQYGEGQLKDL